MEFALKAENVSIRYITGDFKDIGIKEYVMRKSTHNYHVKEFMAVDGVSFTLEHGDMLGIVGTNGAGKSTLLKAVAGIMEPTKGKITANGEVAALLALGSGFDGDLTVKENAYLRGAMLGYTKEFMDQTYDHIIDFAELREFEDRPFKQLSSGMKSRLAFSIASLVKPDILILDEVLSVGDGAFQEKSAKKMREIISQGATTILVSHSLDQIRELCNKVLWLDHGKQIAFGDAQEICDQYERFLNGDCTIESSDGTNLGENNREDIVPLSQEKQRTTPTMKKTLAALISLVMAAFFSFLIFLIGTNVFSANNLQQEIVTIYSQDIDKRVVYRGASVDGKWYNPWENVIDFGNWGLSDEGSSTYTATDGTAFQFILPKAEQRTLTFNVGPNEGSVMVEIGDETVSFDLNAESEVENGLAFDIPFHSGSDYAKYIWIAAAVTFVCVFLLVLMVVGKTKMSTRQKKREVWGDVLRVFCCYIIVLLHNTCTTFSDYADGRISTLIMNCFTGFAVPCFFMISGAYLLRKPQSISTTLQNRILKIVIPTLFWGVIYLCIGSALEINKFIKLLFINQEPHLWFMYSLFGIYMLLPLISYMYHALNFNQKIYALVILLIIPGLIYDGSKLLGLNIPNYSFSIFWPDLGLFLCGGVLWELRSKIRSCRFYQFVLLYVLGLAISVADTVYISQLYGQPDKTFISAIGSWGNLIMAASIFCMALSISEWLQKKVTGLWAQILHEIGNVTMGIYFIHVIFLTHLNHSTMPILPLYNNRGSMLSMILSAFVYFAISAIVCWCGKQVKGLVHMFG